MKTLPIALLCGALAGCNASTPPASNAKPSTVDSSNSKVTANRPLTTERPAAVPLAVDKTNTGVNVRDRDSTAKTSLDQNENTADINITADIRKKVVATKMSINAQNAKIITQDGKVTLRGPVQSEEEKQTIQDIAVQVAGADKVDNQLEVQEK